MLPRLPSLDEIAPGDRALVGGKAFQLARLRGRGLPVPDGFVVTTAAFRQALQIGGLRELASRVAAGEAPVAELRERLRSLRLAGDWAAELSRRAAALGPRVAVRSSGVDEDGAARSFAGQHDTVLGVAPADVPAALVACWASLYSDAAIAYRRGGPAPLPGSMAVLVQRMVAPVAAGVMFTVNPLNGSWREMVVESTWGLGEGLVSGRVTPHWFLVRRPRRAPRPVARVVARVRLQVVQRDVPDIPEQWVAGPDGRVRVEPTPATRRGRSTLDDATLLRLCRLGLRVEGHLGGPQDVEWAVADDGEVVLLQARPITTTLAPRARTDVLWTRRFVGERWPTPATPLGWSLVAPILEWFIAYPEVQDRFLGGGPVLRLVRSRPYVNVTVFRHLAFKAPGSPPPRFMMEFFPDEEVHEFQRRFGVKPSVAVYAAIFRTTFRERRWRRFKWNPFTNHEAWDVYQARLERELPAVSRTPTSPEDAVRLVGASLELVRDYVGVHVTSLLFANMWFQVLEGCLAMWVPERASDLLDDLATCPPGNLTLQTNVALWELAQHATVDDLEALAEGRAPGAAFAARLEAFLADYGHRSSASWEVFASRWVEDPAMLLPLLRGAAPTSPAAHEQRQLDAFRAAERELAEHGPTGWRGAVLRYLVSLTRQYLLLRENQRFWFDRLLLALKRTLQSLGASLVERGVLATVDDVQFLTWGEVVGLVDGSLPADRGAEWVRTRRERWLADAASAEPPVFLRGDDDDAAAQDRSGTRLQGLGVSGGRARGRVRVIRTLAESPRLLPGDVLVTRATDPSWTPLFLTASAVVLELGSRLSHGAVVAREYRVPAVVNVPDVMNRLVDGQEVTVDGTRGVVWIHP